VASPTPEFELLAGRNSPAIQYLGSQSATLSGGTKAGDLVFVRAMNNVAREVERRMLPIRGAGRDA
jgi:hypothetical protein